MAEQPASSRQPAEYPLRTILEALAESVLVINDAGLIVEANDSAGRIFNLPGARLRRSWLFDAAWSYIHEDRRLMAQEDHPAMVVWRTGQAVRNQLLGLQLRGPGPETKVRPVLRWLLASATPLTAPGGSVIEKVILTLVDITESRQALDTVRQSDEQQRSLLESLPLIVLQTNLEQEVVYANPATRAITGYDLEEFRHPELWRQLIHPEDLPALMEASARGRQGETVTLEMRYTAKDGSERMAHCLIQPYRHQNRIQGNITVIVDVTRERRLEEKLRHAQRVEVVGRLASGVAHDFNNMLTAMLTLTEFVKGKLPPDHEAQADLQRLDAAGQQATHLARQLLTFGKQQVPQFQGVPVNLIIRRTLELLRGSWPTEVMVDLQLDTGEPMVWGDPVGIQQIIMNLLLNARDAMPHGGRVTIRSLTRRGFQLEREERAGGFTGPRGPTRPGGPPTPLWVLLSVEDTGLGMEEAVRAKIFEPFFTTKEHGTGLGLAVVQQVLAAHGGWIELHSRPGEGTRFEILLPGLPQNPPDVIEPIGGAGTGMTEIYYR